MRVVFAERALANASSIRAYIADRNPTAAQRVADDLVRACLSLNDFPNRGRPGRVPGTRELVVVYPYVIAYSIEAEEITILSISHGATLAE